MTRLSLCCPDPGYGYCAAREGGRVDRNRARRGDLRGRGCADGRLATTVVAAVVKLSAPAGAPALPVGFIAGAAESGAVAGRSSSSSQVSFQIDIVDIDTGEAEDMLTLTGTVFGDRMAGDVTSTPETLPGDRADGTWAVTRY